MRFLVGILWSATLSCVTVVQKRNSRFGPNSTATIKGVINIFRQSVCDSYKKGYYLLHEKRCWNGQMLLSQRRNIGKSTGLMIIKMMGSTSSWNSTLSKISINSFSSLLNSSILEMTFTAEDVMLEILLPLNSWVLACGDETDHLMSKHWSPHGKSKKKLLPASALFETMPRSIGSELLYRKSHQSWFRSLLMVSEAHVFIRHLGTTNDQKLCNTAFKLVI